MASAGKQKNVDKNIDNLLAAVEGAKRQTVLAACERCRKRKVKCDGQRPCHLCIKHGVLCDFMSNPGETQGQALKRKHDETTTSHGQLQQIYDFLAAGDEGQVRQVLQMIRQGKSPESVSSQVKQARLISMHAESQILGHGHQERSRLSWLQIVINSTASLPEAIQLAEAIRLPSFQIPEMISRHEMRQHALTREMLAGILISKQDHPSISDGFDTGPPLWVPAKPWVAMIDSDEAVSHLVSIYFNYINPYWRVVEQDCFARAMRSRRPSPYCSALLVNTILALASMFAEINEAFATPDDLLTRGLHFELEATRIWHLEGERPTIANVQTGILMSLVTSMRGQDKSGWSFLKTAAELYKTLDGSEAPDFARIRTCLGHAVTFVSCTHVLTTLRPHTSCPASPETAPPDLYNVLPDTVIYWDGYPYLRKPIPFRQNRLAQERSTVVMFLWETMVLLFPGDDTSFDAGVFAQARKVAEKYHDWWTGLPQEFLDTKRSAISIFEIHAQYYGTQVALSSRVLELAASDDKQHNENIEREFRRRRLWFGHRIADMVADLRQVYGFGILPLFIWHACSIALTAFLMEMASATTEPSDRERIDPSFEECFRCLLSAGMQQLLPRIVARSVWHTARQLKVRLPVRVLHMLRLVAESAWQVSDLHAINAAYPSYGVPRANLGQTQDFALEDLLRRWEALSAKDDEIMARMAEQSETTGSSTREEEDNSSKK